MVWLLADKQIHSRLLLGTAQYPSLQIMHDSIKASAASVITVSLRRQSINEKSASVFWQSIKDLGCEILPNTAGCRSVQEAVTMAEMAREVFNTSWIKLEIIGDDFNLQPDILQLVEATKILINKGFEVFPYCTEDLVLCQRLVDAGCRILMPWASPIGSGRGLLNPYALEMLRARLPGITLIIDAGIGKPSHAVHAMELGFDAILLNMAVASAKNPPLMAEAFKNAVQAGRLAFEAGTMSERNFAQPSTPLLDTPFWHQEEKVT